MAWTTTTAELLAVVFLFLQAACCWTSPVVDDAALPHCQAKREPAPIRSTMDDVCQEGACTNAFYHRGIISNGGCQDGTRSAHRTAFYEG